MVSNKEGMPYMPAQAEQVTPNRPIYTRAEAEAASTAYFNGDDLAARVWVNKYALKDNSGAIYERTPADMHRRLAAELARVERNYENPVSFEEIYSLLDGFKYVIPQGSPMSGIGNDFQTVSISNCFVVGVDGPADSYGGIFMTDQEAVQLMKRRGGVGNPMDDIRPAGTAVNNAAITSTGVVPFMERYSNSTREVAQDGRRGARMLSISIKHPESERFIDAKMTEGKVTGANISVGISDDFMRAALAKHSFTLQWPVDVALTEALVQRETDAASLWGKIIHNAWKSAEPGVLFWDQIIRESLPDCYAHLGFKTISTNPCGEIPLCADDSCRLLALNLYSYVVNPFTPQAYFDFDLFRKHVTIAQRLMDDIIDLELEKIDAIIAKIATDPEKEAVKRVEMDLWRRIRTKCIQGRRTGCGVTAEGDMLAALGKRYGTPEATETSVGVHRAFALAAYRSSVVMAKERGAFPIYDAALESANPFLRRLFDADPELEALHMLYGRRNIALLTIAPTGTVSMMAQTTSGIECAFLVAYTRRRKVNPNDVNVRVDYVDEVGDQWENNFVFHHHFKTWLQVNGYDVEAVARMGQAELDAVIAKSPYYKALSNDVDWVEKVRMQGLIQQWIDHSISVTVNLPADATEALVNDVYVAAWRNGCKGCTIYRDGSRGGVLVSAEESKKSAKEEAKEELFKESHAPKRPKHLDCDVHRFMLRGGRWIGFVGLLEGKPYELFAGPAEMFKVPSSVEAGRIRRTKVDGHSRYDFVYETKDSETVVAEGLNTAFDPQTYDTSRILSAVLRHGMPLHYVVQMIESLQLDGDLINTWKTGVKRMIKKYIPDGTAVKADGKAANCPGNDGDSCNLVYQEGCLICTTCGNSKCG